VAACSCFSETFWNSGGMQLTTESDKLVSIAPSWQSQMAAEGALHLVNLLD